MIPKKLSFVEQKNTKNAKISEKSTEIKRFFGKNRQFADEIPLDPQKNYRDTSGRPPPSNNAIKKIIQRCRERNNMRLSALKTRVAYHRDGYGKRYAQYAVAYAAGKTVDPEKLSRADLGFMPIAESGHCPEKYGAEAGKDWETTYGVSDWKPKSWRDAYGLQIYTGIPSGNLTSLDFEYAIVRDYPKQFLDTLSRLCELTESPLLIITKSGGLRFECRTPDYAHLKRDQRYVATWQNHHAHEHLYLEIFGEKGLSRYDARYEIYTGSLLNIPVIDHHALFNILDELQEQIGTPRPEKSKTASKHKQRTENHEQASNASRVKIVDGLPEDIAWRERKDGSFESLRSDYPCHVTKHRKSHGAAQYYQQSDGQVDAFCYNCQQAWIVKHSDHTARINEIRAGRLSPLAVHRKTVKLIKDTHAHALLDTLAKAGERIAAFLRSTTRVLAFRADTGTGKNHETETYAINDGAILVNVPTGDLAIDLETRMHGRLSDAGLPSDQVFRRRGLMHRWRDGEDAHNRFPHEIPCIQAPRCDTYRKKGGNMYKTICPDCPEKTKCTQYGYLSQPEQAKNARMVITSHPDFHLNPANRGFAKPYLTDITGAQRLIVQDDVSTHALFLECQITRKRLQQIRDDWDGAFPASFAKELLRILDAEGTPYAIRDFLDTLTQKQKGILNYQLTRVRIQTTQAGGTPVYFDMTLDNAVTNGFFHTENESEIAEMPAVYPKHWTLLDQLTAFFQHYKRAEDAPIQYHNGTLKFALPPRLHNTVWKAVFMSATLDLDLFKRAFPEAHTEDVPPTQWTDKAKVYQLRTNRNPRATVYNVVDGEIKGLSDTGENYWRMMINQIANTPDTKHAIITYKQVFDWKNNEVAADFSELDNIIATAHYGNLVGLDTNFQDAETLWILFSPEIPHGNELPENEIAWRAKMFFGDDEKPMNYKRDPETGMYRDKRLQKVWENAVIGELIQAIGRARLVRKARTVVLLTSHFIPGITNRPETRLFDEADWEIAGGLDGLDEVITNREAYEVRAATLTAENTVADFQEVFGCSERHARRLWEKSGGKDSKIDENAKLAERAQELHDQGLSLRKIASELGIPKSTIDRFLKRRKVSQK